MDSQDLRTLFILMLIKRHFKNLILLFNPFHPQMGSSVKMGREQVRHSKSLKEDSHLAIVPQQKPDQPPLKHDGLMLLSNIFAYLHFHPFITSLSVANSEGVTFVVHKAGAASLYKWRSKLLVLQLKSKTSNS